MTVDERLNELDAKLNAVELVASTSLVVSLVDDLAKAHLRGETLDQAIDGAKGALNDRIEQAQKMLRAQQLADDPRSEMVMSHLTRIYSNISATLEQGRGLILK